VIRLRATESILIWTALNMSEIGKKTNKMVRGRKLGQMGLNTKAITSWAKNIAKVFSSGQMDLPIKANFNQTTSKVRGCTAGRTAEAIVGPGGTTRWTEEVCSLGQMAVGTRESTSKTRNRVSAPFIGLMEEST